MAMKKSPVIIPGAAFIRLYGNEMRNYGRFLLIQ